jgi:glycerol-3-phosphate dehydrogenase
MVMSNMYRASFRERAAERYDIIVVGGGIYGAAVAWEAVSRGLSAILIEKGDFGGGTSANSLKVIHGGVRYLQNLNISRVMQSAQERNILMRIAPHLVSPLECVMPTYRELRKSKIAIWVGFGVYDILSWNRNRALGASHYIPKGSIISRDELKMFLPGFENDDITGGARWYDAQVYNTERLVLAFVMSARNMGACVQNYVRMEEVLVNHNQVAGIKATTTFANEEYFIEGNVVVDCRGPWATSDTMYRKLGLAAGDSLPALAVATNLIVYHQFAPVAVGMKIAPENPNERSERLLFVVPWRNASVIGTWYRRDSSHEPDDTLIADGEVDTIIEETNMAFPYLRLKRNDVALVHRGRLPLAAGSEGANEVHLRDKPILLHTADVGGPNGLFLVQGVKYTMARRVAVKVIDLVARVIGKPVGQSVSNVKPLYGGHPGSHEAFVSSQMQRLTTAFSMSIAARLLSNYGSNVSSILGYADKNPRLAALVPGTEDVIQAELHYVLDYELTYTLSDLLLRRTDIGSMCVPKGETIDFCADLMANKLGWDHQTTRANVETLLERYPHWTISKAVS